MATVSYRLEDLKKAIVGIGYVGENDHMHVLIDCKEVFDEYPDAVPTMAIVPPVGEGYPKTVTRNGDVVEWLVKDSDVTVEGDGEFQLTFTEGEIIRKSVNGRFRVKRSISGSGSAPSGVQDWLTDANEKLAEVEEATRDAEAAANHQPYIGIDGYWYTWNGEEFVKNVKAQGEKGDPGDPGSPGDPTKLINDTDPALDKTFSSSKIDTELTDVKNAIQGVDDEMDGAVFFEETQDDDSIEGIIKSEIINKMEFSLSGVNLSIVYDGTVIDTVQLPSAQPVPCTGVALDITVTALEAGKTVTLTATLTPSNTTDMVVWSTSDDTVATVNNGVVTGVAKGTATITVTCGSFSDTCSLTVVAYYQEPVLGYVLSESAKISYRSGYSYKKGGVYNDPFLRKLTSGQTVTVDILSDMSNVSLQMIVYKPGTMSDKVESSGNDYILTQEMLDMESGSSYMIMKETELLYSYMEYMTSSWVGSYTASQDCYVVFFFTVPTATDITSDLTDIKNAMRIEVA